jgi:hypothetical protein
VEDSLTYLNQDVRNNHQEIPDNRKYQVCRLFFGKGRRGNLVSNGEGFTRYGFFYLFCHPSDVPELANVSDIRDSIIENQPDTTYTTSGSKFGDSYGSSTRLMKYRRQSNLFSVNVLRLNTITREECQIRGEWRLLIIKPLNHNIGNQIPEIAMYRFILPTNLYGANYSYQPPLGKVVEAQTSGSVYQSSTLMGNVETKSEQDVDILQKGSGVQYAKQVATIYQEQSALNESATSANDTDLALQYQTLLQKFNALMIQHEELKQRVDKMEKKEA